MAEPVCFRLLLDWVESSKDVVHDKRGHHNPTSPRALTSGPYRETHGLTRGGRADRSLEGLVRGDRIIGATGEQARVASYASDPNNAALNVQETAQSTALTLHPASHKQARLFPSSQMSSGISVHLTSLVCWSFAPSFLSNFLLSLFYRLFPSHRPTVPSTASPAQLAYENARAQKHARNARVVLIAAYLVWTVASTYLEQGRPSSQNFYTLLGLPRAIVESGGASAVKSHWRKLARLHHPDKVGKQGEQYFVELRRGVEVLENEGAKRWAYERLGRVVLEWKLVTHREFLVRGAQQSAVFYVFALGSIIAISFFRKEERAHSYVRLFISALLSLARD
jgi:hypothetical protein